MMELRNGKKLRFVPKRVGRDRLSEMPDEIIVHILSFLPIVDAVRTVLLRRFGNLWTLVPSLCFNYSEFHGIYCPKSEHSIRTAWRKWYSRFIRKVLFFHRRLTIDEFKLFTTGRMCASKISDRVKKLLRSALRRKEIKALEFKVMQWGSRNIHGSILPRCVFTSPSLVTLKLCRVQIEYNNHQVRLGSLRKLSLKNVLICDMAFEELISGCPRLQELDVEDLVELVKLRFTNPSIEMLRLSLRNYPRVLDFPNLKRLDLDILGSIPHILDVSSLRQVNISHLWSSDCNFLKKFQDVEAMKISREAFYGFISSVKDVDARQIKWKRLVLDCVCLKNYGDLFSICQLLTSSTCLEELVMYSSKAKSASLKPDSDLDSSSELSCCVIPNLKTVTIHGYESPNILQYFIKFLLKGALVLDELLIVQGAHPLTAVEELKFVKQISSIQWASAKARVVFA